LDAVENYGNSALHIAARCGYPKLLRLLLGSMGAMASMTNKAGKKVRKRVCEWGEGRLCTSCN
jgi:hypothetical protein